MKRPDQSFFLLLLIGCGLLIALVSENIYLSNAPENKVDIKKVMADLEKAGLVPHEAKYWRKL